MALDCPHCGARQAGNSYYGVNCGQCGRFIPARFTPEPLQGGLRERLRRNPARVKLTIYPSWNIHDGHRMNYLLIAYYADGSVATPHLYYKSEEELRSAVQKMFPGVPVEVEDRRDKKAG